VARFYSNENIALQLVIELRRLGHDLLTSLDAGNANSAIPDSEVLMFAVSESRILLSCNRRDFLKLHQRRDSDHEGMVLITVDPDWVGQAQRIHQAVADMPDMRNKVIRVNRRQKET